MATLYVSEYGGMSIGNIGPQPIAPEPAIVDQAFTFTGTSAQSSAFSSGTHMIRVHTDAICSILIGADPTSTTAKKRLAANQTEYFGVKPGHKIAAIVNT